METDAPENLFDESITLELNVSNIYGFFAESLPLDRSFWLQLQREEKSHAQLIRTARDSYLNRGIFPCSLITASTSELQLANQHTLSLVEQFQKQAPDRFKACLIAIELEKSAGEIHFAKFVEKEATNAIDTVFQQLNRDDKYHIERISEYYESIRIHK